MAGLAPTPGLLATCRPIPIYHSWIEQVLSLQKSTSIRVKLRTTRRCLPITVESGRTSGFRERIRPTYIQEGTWQISTFDMETDSEGETVYAKHVVPARMALYQVRGCPRCRVWSCLRVRVFILPPGTCKSFARWKASGCYWYRGFAAQVITSIADEVGVFNRISEDRDGPCQEMTSPRLPR